MENIKTTWSYPLQYRIEGAGMDPGQAYHYLNDENLYPNFQEEFIQFKELLLDLRDNPKPVTFLRYGDGDHFVIIKNPVGSAQPGRRALGKSYDSLSNHQEFVDGVLQNDYIAAEIFPTARKYFREVFTGRKIDFPLEYIYGVIANRWFFEKFKDKKIGIIGAKEKIDIIKNLMSYKEYQEYLGLEKFNSYISIPQQFAMDDLDKLEENVASQLKDSDCDFYIYGIGHVKLGLAHRFKKYSDKPFLDIGCGIDAIAGSVSITRPYFYDWVNYRMKDYNYSGIDYMGYRGAGKHIIL